MPGLAAHRTRRALLLTAHRTRRALLLTALCGLLLAQGLALWHALSHGHGRGHGTDVVQAEPAQAQAWGHADGAPDCRLVDQLLTGLAGTPSLRVLALAQPLQGTPVVGTPVRARGPAASFLARAPPLG
jgi:hypothetical protein